MKKYSLCIVGILVFILYMWMNWMEQDPLQPMIASKILRFHVLANSDSEADQAVKVEVRDAVGTYLSPLLEFSDDLEETKEIVNENMGEIIAVAEKTLAAHGFAYEVTASVTQTSFPQKTYGEYTFPKGTYEALQIVIGEGQGQNWWCVLYPNMCFKGSVYEVIEEDAKEALKEVLSPWEYADVFDGDHRIEFRWKILEYFKD